MCERRVATFGDRYIELRAWKESFCGISRSSCFETDSKIKKTQTKSRKACRNEDLAGATDPAQHTLFPGSG